MKKILTLPLLMLLAIACSNSRDDEKQLQPDAEDSLVVESAEPQTLTLLFAGDLMQHKPQFDAARRSDGTYDYSGCFDEVKAEIEAADVAIANLETTLGGKNYAGYPCFCSPDAYAMAIRDAGFDMLMTCNNHSCDTRLRGINRTISVLDSLQIPHFGTYVDSVAREAQYPYLLEAKGFRIALLAYTYGTNGLPVPQPSIVNLIDTTQIAIDIRKAQQMQPDAIIAFMHWGVEYVLNPSARQTQLVDWLLKKGVNHVIGGHPHVCQPIELRDDSLANDKHLVVYSLGNYVSHQCKPNTTGGLMVRLTLERDTAGQCRTQGADYSLIWVDRPSRSHKRVHRVLPIDYPDSLLTPVSIQQRKEFVQNMHKLFSTKNKGIEMRNSNEE